MALIDITPTMTSNTTPSPYVVTASTFYTGQESYKAFDGVKNIAKNAWVTASGNTTGWISLDFGSDIKCSAFSLTSRSTGGFSGTPPAQVGTTEAPRNFKLYGSRDNVSYDLIVTLDNEILWTPQETRLYNLPSDVTYRYYKLMISANNGFASYVGVGEITFYQDDGVTPVENNKTVSRRYTLPFGSKLRLDNLTSDLPYMLGVEDDGINEGTFRLVNHAGKFIIPMAGIKTESIWKGSITKDEIATLSKSISNFKLLIIEIKSGNGLINYISVPVNNIVLNKTDYITSMPWIPTYYCSGRYGFLTEYTFTIIDSANAGMGVFTVTEIIGIY